MLRNQILKHESDNSSDKRKHQNAFACQKFDKKFTFCNMRGSNAHALQFGFVCKSEKKAKGKLFLIHVVIQYKPSLSESTKTKYLLLLLSSFGKRFCL